MRHFLSLADWTGDEIRGLLALAARLQERRRSAAFPLPPATDPYFRRLLAAVRGEGLTVRVVAYSYHPSAMAQEGLRALLGGTELTGGLTALPEGLFWSQE